MFISGPQLPPHQRAPKPTDRSYSGVCPVQSWDKPRLALLPNQAEKPPQSKDTSHGAAHMETRGHSRPPLLLGDGGNQPIGRGFGALRKAQPRLPNLLPASPCSVSETERFSALYRFPWDRDIYCLGPQCLFQIQDMKKHTVSRPHCLGHPEWTLVLWSIGHLSVPGGTAATQISSRAL